MIRKLVLDAWLYLVRLTSSAWLQAPRLGLLSSIGIAVSLAAPVFGQATFKGLGLFGGLSSTATDVSADGSVVVGTVRITGGLDLFRWTSDETIVRSEGGASQPAVSADGSVVVGREFFPPMQAFRWRAGGPFMPLGGLPGEPVESEAFDVSADGSVVVGRAFSSGRDQAFLWTQETGMAGLGDIPGGLTDSVAVGVSDNGLVVVGYGHENESSRQASRWTAATGMVGLGFLPGGNDSVAQATSADGSVVVGVNRFPALDPPRPDAESLAFRWTEGDGMVSLDDLPGGPRLSYAFDVSADGDTIVGYGRDEFGRRAMLWTPESGMLDLRNVLVSLGVTNLDGWTLAEARGISADGRTIVGVGEFNGRTEAWVATIPEPSAVMLCCCAALGLIVFAAKRRLGRRIATA